MDLFCGCHLFSFIYWTLYGNIHKVVFDEHFLNNVNISTCRILGRWERRLCNTDILELHQIADQCLNCVTTGWLFLNCRLQPPIKENRWPPIKIANATIDASSFKITSSLSPLILIALSLGCLKFYVFWNSSLICSPTISTGEIFSQVVAITCVNSFLAVLLFQTRMCYILHLLCNFVHLFVYFCHIIKYVMFCKRKAYEG